MTHTHATWPRSCARRHLRHDTGKLFLAGGPSRLMYALLAETAAMA
eukprot:CAMPEP_0119388624 /NCGR_PEP_ID=MMETSP1334-20130426/105839_1 /TAXON_ID=127549 /ORGANISM="Calcidiscus leptoporus, Strain RCC1130" /LENGTH=45 /DNA_ID= /DNA_START= /DNA_END= /DNA_ORIENTATION=